MLDVGKGKRADERFHLQSGPPVPHLWRSWFGIVRHVTWSNLFLEDGSPGQFESWWIIGNALHWYKGTVKIDGTRTRMYWSGQLDDGNGARYIPDANKYVATTTEREKFSVRFFVDPNNPPTWDTMGNS
jgi:hypothetical protein